MGANFKLIGDQQLLAQLKRMEQATTQQVIEKSFRTAARPLVEKAKANAPMGETGNLKKSIGIFASRSQDRRSRIKAGLWVGPRIRGGFKGYHAHLVEFGTETRRPKNGAFLVFEYNGVKVFAKQAKGMTPNPFMIPAYNETKGTVERRIQEETRKNIQKAIK